MLARPFRQVDVFTATPYFGNALAVVNDASGLSDEAMLRFARWTNLSETTFLLAPTPDAAAAGADYQVRIFTPGYEMPFAGHPTLGSCHAWLEGGGVPQDPEYIVQQCKVGLVKIRRTPAQTAPSGYRLAFAAPPLTRTTPSADIRNALAQALGLQPQHILDAQQLTNGPRHFGFLVDSVDTVLALAPDMAALALALPLAGVTGVGVAAIAPDQESPALIARSNREARAFGAAASRNADVASQEEPTVELRFFFQHATVGEDPVTGSFNASMAQWLIAEGHVPQSYVVAQGTCIGREGRVHVAQDGAGQVWIGGDAVTCIRGEVLL